ncbi:MAG: PPOX class F420-dependent oxidoreductase [Anaerolinea sp.]|nr:PPOX class F420-dependent oxidoreductase [Anaerolinea sp.]
MSAQTQTAPAAGAFVHLQGHQYMSLTTFRKNGQPVPTPVWFAQEGDKLYVMTQPDSGKVKRIRHNAQVEVAPCDVRGKVLGETHEAMARILPPDQADRADKALSRKYGIQKQIFSLVMRLRGKSFAYLELTSME